MQFENHLEKGLHNMTNLTQPWGDYLTFAKLPAENPAELADFSQNERYTITPIEHDYAGKTAVMWNSAYRHFGIKTRMAMMVGKVSDAEEILRGFRLDSHYIGGGSGVGFKDENIKYLDELDPLAQAVGAVNVIQKLPSGKLKGWNTDGVGYRQSIEQVLATKGETLQGARVVILGAGGTGSAIALALAEKGAIITIINRTISKGVELADRVNNFTKSTQATAFGEDMLEQVVQNATVVINVSTKGASGDFEEYSALAPARLPATPENITGNLQQAEDVLARIPSDVILSDVVLRTTPSPFLKGAAIHGFTTLDGIPMVINQGVQAFMILHEDELHGDPVQIRKELEKVMREAAGF